MERSYKSWRKITYSKWPQNMQRQFNKDLMPADEVCGLTIWYQRRKIDMFLKKLPT